MATSAQQNLVASSSASPEARLRAGISSGLSRWRMLAGVQRLGVGVSGGADSLALLSALVGLDLGVELVPVHIHQHPAHQQPALLGDFIDRRFGLETHVVQADTSLAARAAIKDGKAPCRACAPVRAKALAEAADTLNVDALALGHHLDDAVATLLMNIFHRGQTDTIRPVARRKENPGIPILRPMLLIGEVDVKAGAPTDVGGLFDCGMCSAHSAERARASAFVRETFEMHPPATRYAAQLVARLGAIRQPPKHSGRRRRP